MDCNYKHCEQQKINKGGGGYNANVFKQFVYTAQNMPSQKKNTSPGHNHYFLLKD